MKFIKYLISAALFFNLANCIAFQSKFTPKFESEYNKFTEISSNSVTFTNKAKYREKVIFKLIKSKGKNTSEDTFLAISVPYEGNFLLGDYAIFYLDGKPLKKGLSFYGSGKSILISNSSISNTRFVTLDKESSKSFAAAHMIRYEFSHLTDNKKELSGVLSPNEVGVIKKFLL